MKFLTVLVAVVIVLSGTQAAPARIVGDKWEDSNDVGDNVGNDVGYNVGNGNSLIDASRPSEQLETTKGSKLLRTIRSAPEVPEGKIGFNLSSSPVAKTPSQSPENTTQGSKKNGYFFRP